MYVYVFKEDKRSAGYLHDCHEIDGQTIHIFNLSPSVAKCMFGHTYVQTYVHMYISNKRLTVNGLY